MNQFLFFFTILSTSLLFFFLVGAIPFSVLKANGSFSFQTVFRNIFTGYILSIVVYSLVKTSGVTVNIIFLLLFVIGAIEIQRWRQGTQIENTRQKSQKTTVVWVSLGGLFFVFTWSWFSITSGYADFIFNYNDFDYILYSRIAKSIGETGQENGFYFLNTYDKFYNGVEPYHYFDLWGGSLVGSIFSVNHFIALKLVVYPTFYFLVFLAYASLIENKPLLKIVICILLLFLGGIFLDYYKANRFLAPLGNLKHFLLTPNMNKLSYFYVFFMASYLLYSNRAFMLSVLVLFALPIANIISLPIYAAVFLTIIYARVFKKLSQRDFRNMVIYLMIVALGLITFYSIFKRNGIGLAGSAISSPIELIKSNLGTENLKTRINILFGGPLHLIILYFPLLLSIGLFFYFLKLDLKRYKIILLFSFCLVAICLLAWALLFRELNSPQLFCDTVIVLVNILLAIFILEVFNKSKSYTCFFLFVIIFFFSKLIINGNDILEKRALSHSIEYLTRVSEVVKEKALLRGASVKDSSILKNPFEKYNVLYPLGNYLNLINEDVSIVNIGDLDTPIDSASTINLDRSFKALQNGMFYRYVKNNGGASPYTPLEIERLQQKYIRDYHIQFAIFSQESKKYPLWLTGKEEVITDALSGERFVVLNFKSGN